MGIRDPWHDGIAQATQDHLEGIARTVRWCVEGTDPPTPAFIDAVVDGCREALALDPRLTDFVVCIHGVANGQTVHEYSAHGATTVARAWARLGDRLQDLTGTEALGGP